MIPALLVDAVAAYRLTRLVTADDITAPIRDGIVEWSYGRLPDVEVDKPAIDTWTDVAISDPDAPKLATLVTCRWCAGMWISFGVVAARRLAPRAWSPVADALVCSAAAALLAGFEE